MKNRGNKELEHDNCEPKPHNAEYFHTGLLRKAWSESDKTHLALIRLPPPSLRTNFVRKEG